MKLFLTSLASTTLDLVLPLLPDNPRNLKLAFIATAADPYTGESMPWLDADREKLTSMGFTVTNYDLKGKDETTLRSELSEFQVIFVSGGNVYYLLNEARKSGFDIVIKELIKHGTIYIGASAGSVLLCSTIDHVRLIEHPEVVPELTDYKGLGIVQELIVPHYGKEKYADRIKQIIDVWENKILLLKDDQVLVVNDDNIEVLTK